MVAALDLDVDVLHPELFHLRDPLPRLADWHGVVVALQHEDRQLPEGVELLGGADGAGAATASPAHKPGCFAARW